MKIQIRFAHIYTFLIIITLFFSTFGSDSFAAGINANTHQVGDGYIPGELIIGVEQKNGKSTVNIHAISSDIGASIVDTALDGDFYLLRFQNDIELLNKMDWLARQPGIRYVERNGFMSILPDATLSAEDPRTTYTPNDPHLKFQWYLDKILYNLTDAPETEKVPCIVVLDTGVDYDHPDLSGKVFKGKDIIDNDFDPMDMQGHGTHVAGIIGAVTDNSIGISGVSPNSNILAVRVLDANGIGTFDQIAQGIQWANSAVSSKCGGQRVKIYNLSLSGDFSQAVSDAIKAALDKGRLVVAEVGDNNSSTKYYPGADINVLGVAATEENDRRTYSSNYDTASDPWIDIAAPGYNIYSTVNGGGYDYYLGERSMAAPIVSGIAARIWAKYPTKTAAAVRSKVINNADSVQGFPRTEIKRVNLFRSLGGGSIRTLQGRIIDTINVKPLTGAIVNVWQLDGTPVCTITTTSSGFFTCIVPGDGNYKVRAAKSGYLPIERKFGVIKRKFNAILGLSLQNGTSTSNDWSVALLWKGWQPYQSVGREFDIWLVKPFPLTCYSYGQSGSYVLVPADSYKIGQSEGALVQKAQGRKLNIWVGLWDGGSYWVNSRLTGTGLEVRVYKNNTLVQWLIAPKSPISLDADNWLVGQIDLVNDTWKYINKIKSDTQLPACVKVSP